MNVLVPDVISVLYLPGFCRWIRNLPLLLEDHIESSFVLADARELVFPCLVIFFAKKIQMPIVRGL